jgi:hypothetical protein
LDRICVSLATADLLILLQKATPQVMIIYKKRFCYLQLLNLQRAITKSFLKKISRNSVFTSKPCSKGRSFSDNESKLEVLFRKIELEGQMISDVQFNTIKENIGLLKLLDQNKMYFMIFRPNLLKTPLKRDLVIIINRIKNYLKALSGIQ